MVASRWRVSCRDQYSDYLAAAGDGGGGQPGLFLDASRWAIARTAGASDAFANTFFLMGMFERLVRDWAGPQARFTKMGPLKMLNFNVVGDTYGVQGRGGVGRNHCRRATLGVGVVVRE